MAFLNRCIWTAASTGTVNFVVSASAQNGYVPAQCLNPSVVTGSTYHYFATNGVQHEEGDGVYTVGTSTLTRAFIRNSSNSDLIVNFIAPPTVFMGGPTANDMPAIGSPILSGTSGSVLFVNSSSNFGQDNAKFFWDDTNYRLGIGTATPSTALDLTTAGVISFSGKINYSGTQLADFYVANDNNHASIAIGVGALAHVPVGSANNIAIGINSMSSGSMTSTAANNVAIGAYTSTTLTSGIGNVSLGTYAGESFQDTNNNFALGSYSLQYLQYQASGGSNVAIGTSALQYHTAGYNNVAIGQSAMQNITTAYSGNNIAIGGLALIGSAGGYANNVVIGGSAGQNLTSGYGNVILGGWTGPVGAVSNSIILADGNGNLLLDYNYSNNNTWTFDIVANATALKVNGYSLTGTDAHAMFDLAGTWNTTGTPTAFKLNITNTASANGSKLASFQYGGSPIVEIGSWNSGYSLDVTADAGVGYGFRVQSPAGGGDWFTIVNGVITFNAQGGHSSCATSGFFSGNARFNIGTLFNGAHTALAIAGYTGQSVPIFTVDKDESASTNGSAFVVAANGFSGVSNTNPLTQLDVGGGIASKLPTTLTGTTGAQAVTDSSLIVNASGGFTLTLLAAASYPGRWLTVKTIANQTVTSASSNVVPIGSATAGTAVLAATAGKWAILQSDGTNWITMANN